MAKEPPPYQATIYGISMLKTVRANQAWRPDAFETLLVALEERSTPVRRSEVSKALEYLELVNILKLYLADHPSVEHKTRLVIRVGEDLLGATGNASKADTKDYEQVSAILRRSVLILKNM